MPKIRETLERYAPGAIVTELAFTSTSRGGVDPQYADGNIEFVIYSHSGKDISGISPKSSEREVLIPAGARFRVRDVKPATESYPIQIILVEVE